MFRPADDRPRIHRPGRAHPGPGPRSRLFDGTLHSTPEEHELTARLTALARDRAGRLVFDGYPTGVTVGWAQQHGGPYPATTAPTTTSVGTAAIARFLRPVVYQNCPPALLPPALRDDNPWSLPRRRDGVLELP